jgi:hypothetical protein
MTKSIRTRLDKLEAHHAQAVGADVRSQLPALRYAEPRVYNTGQLLELHNESGLAGAVARGLLRLKRHADDAPRIAFDAEAELIRTCAGCYEDPLSWVIFAFDWGSEAPLRLVPLPERLRSRFAAQHGPDDWAAQFLEDLGQEIEARPFDRTTAVPAVRMAVASGHSIGKTVVQSWLVLWSMATRENCRGVATSTTSAQLATRLWPEMQAWLKRSVVAHWFECNTARNNMRLFHREHPEVWRFDGATAAPENSEAFAGLHNATSSTVFLLDEASGIDTRIWRAIEGSMVDGAPLLVATGNPLRRDGEFFRVFTDQSHRWNLRHVDSRQAHLTNKAQIAEWLADWGEDSDFFRCRVRGLFPSQSLSQFISAEAVKESQTRQASRTLLSDIGILGCDVARFGTDASTIATRIGRDARTFPVKSFRGLDTQQFAMEIARWANELRMLYRLSGVLICVDGIGIGAGVVDTLRAMGFDVRDVQAAGRARDDRKHANVRAELWGGMRDWITAEGLLADDDELAEDLTAPDFLFDTKGRIQIEKKDAIRARLGRSPDKADALALTFAVATPASNPGAWADEVGEYNDAERQKVLAYDPLAAAGLA